MTNHQILNPADHAGLRIRVETRADLGDAVMACFAAPAEFRRLACHYPILFRYDNARQSFGALVLLGFEPGENLFIGQDSWRASSRPFAIAVQPFLIGRSRENSGPSQVHIDMDHPRISKDGEGVRVFDDSGRPTPFLEEVSRMLGALEDGQLKSESFYDALDRYKLFEPFSMDVTLDNGAANRLVGYHLINEERLRTLEPAALAELHRDGHFEAAYMALASLGNLGKLVRLKNRRVDV